VMAFGVTPIDTAARATGLINRVTAGFSELLIIGTIVGLPACQAPILSL
jgi:hypothetical protein